MGYDMTFEVTPERGDDYFRLNIWGMQEYRRIMQTIGMVAPTTTPLPAWPDPETFDIPGVMVDGYLYPNEDSPEYQAYRRANEQVLAWTDTTVIAYHKLCSNDGWLVTPPEIRGALDAYRAYLDRGDDITRLTDDSAYWNKWIAYLTRAAEHGGFRVY